MSPLDYAKSAGWVHPDATCFATEALKLAVEKILDLEAKLRAQTSRADALRAMLDRYQDMDE